MADLSPIMLAHFWGRVAVTDDGACWIWTGNRNGKYGKYRGIRAHRLAYELVNGEIPESLLIRHTCDNPLCCNPRHLLPGTSQDNTNDAIERNRFAKGERHGNTKLTAAQVDEIRRNPDGKSGRELAFQFRVSPATISYIRSGRSWR